jgi:RHS repeat-associated protein
MKDGTQFIQTTGSSCPPGGCYKEVFTDTGSYNTINWTNNSITDLVGRTVTVQTAGSGFSSPAMTSSNATIVLQYPDSSGTTRTVQVQMQTMQFSCPNGQSLGGEAGINGVTFSMPTAIILPNGLTYTFQYDACGALRKVTYPTGEYTRFDYSTAPMQLGYNSGSIFTYYQNEVTAKYVCPVPAVTLGATSAPSGDNCPVPEETTTYTPTWYQSTNGNSNTQEIVFDPVGNKTVYQFALPSSIYSYPAVETSRQYYDASGKLWKTVATQYSDTTSPGSTYGASYAAVAPGDALPRLPTIQTTTLDNGMVSQIQWSYNFWSPYANDSVLTEERVYDYGLGTPSAVPIKTTDYTWLHRDDPNDYGWSGGIVTQGQLRAHICDRKTSEKIYDGNGKLLEQTKYAYDYGSPTTYGAKGLLTSVQKWRNTDGAWLTTSYQYNGLYGNVTQETDPNGNVTQFSYTDNYADGVNRNSYGFLTKTTDPLNHVTQSQYYWGSGLVAATCGENFSGTCAAGLTSGADYASYTYDLMGREISVTTGDGGQTSNCFSDEGGPGCSAQGYPLQVTSTEKVASGVTKVSTSIAMHPINGVPAETSQLNSDPSCQGGTVNVDTTYDADGRKYTVTNPYCSNNPGAPTAGTTTYAYDGLSRVYQVTHPDSTYATNTYSGRAVLSADEGNGTNRIQRVSQTDALGRLLYVCEVTGQTQQGSNNSPSACGLDISSSPYTGSISGFLTTYGYDASNSNGPLESLTTVTQGGVGRSFIYDSLGELRSATNPESGTTVYTTYDSDGNLKSKTDAKGIVTTYNYDNLNRLTSKSYSDGITPSACFEYDASSYGIGRLATEWTQMGTCPSAPPSSGILTQRTFAAYDPLGRVTADEQCALLGNCTGGGAYTLSYGYDLAGDVTSFNNGLIGSSALSFTGQYNSAGRLSTVNGSASPGGASTPLFMATGYTPAGALSNAMIGTGSIPGITFQRSYNNRLLPTAETDTVATTPGTATALISGSEQLYAYSGGNITFSGTEQCSGGTCDGGQFLVTIGIGQPILVDYGQNSTPSTLASNLASIIGTGCTNYSVQAASNGATVSLQSCAAGTNNGYSISATPDGHSSSFSSYSFAVTTSGSTMTPIINGTTLGHSGVAATFITTGSGQVGTGMFQFFVYLAGTGPPGVYSGTLSWSSTDTTSTLAARLASAIGSCTGSGAAVGALADGPSIYLVSCQAGASYVFQSALDYSNGSAGFQVNMTATPASAELPSVTFSGTEEGGQSGGILVYVSPNQNHGPVTVNWNSSSTPSILAASLASGLGTCSSNGNGMVGVASGATVYLSPCQPSVSYTISASVVGCSCSSGNSADFSVAVTTAPATGQLPPVSGAVYDTGSVALVVNGTQIATTSYSAESTPQSIASALTTAASGNSLVTVAVSGGFLTMTAQGDGTITDYSYQVSASSSQPVIFTSASFSGSPGSGTLTGGTNVPLYSWSINTYAPNGDVESMTDSVMGTWSYGYDDFNRLTSGSATAGVDNGLTLGWTYDRYGNRWAQNATGSGNASAVQPQLSFSGNNNHVDGWSYDADGNLLNDGRNSYAYDAEGRIITLNGAPTYVYDAEGIRVAKYSGGTISASYLIGLGGDQVTEFNNTGAWVHSNVWAGGKLLATYEGTAGPHPNTWHFHLTDWLGTERMQNTAVGNNEEVCYSYPFGDGLTCSGSADATEHHFTSKERDAESGLDYFEARYLSSDLARFMTPDWAAKPTDVPYATFGDPQSLDLYGYVENNPLVKTDSNGHIGDCSCEITDAQLVHAFNQAAITLADTAIIGAKSLYSLATTGHDLSSAQITKEESQEDSHSTTTTPPPAPTSTAGPATTPAPATDPATPAVPGFVADAGGNVVKIPAGSTVKPATNGNGKVYQPPVAAGAHPNANAVRVMGPHAHQPTGSITVHNEHGQPINPASGKPDTPAKTHTSIKLSTN